MSQKTRGSQRDVVYSILDAQYRLRIWAQMRGGGGLRGLNSTDEHSVQWVQWDKFKLPRLSWSSLQFFFYVFKASFFPKVFPCIRSDSDKSLYSVGSHPPLLHIRGHLRQRQVQVRKSHICKQSQNIVFVHRLYLYVCFYSGMIDQRYSPSWWFWLQLTGIMLGKASLPYMPILLKVLKCAWQRDRFFDFFFNWVGHHRHRDLASNSRRCS